MRHLTWARPDLSEPPPILKDQARQPPSWRSRAAIGGLLLACVIGMAAPSLAAANSGALTYATIGQDQKHGAITGSVTWDECASASQCWWEPFVIVKPAAEPCSVGDISQASQLNRGEATTPIYQVWADGGWTENGTIKVSEIGFPAVVGQQACLFVSYKTFSGDGACESGRGPCNGSEPRQEILLAERAFVPEQRPVSPVPLAPAASTPAPPAATPSTPAPPAGAAQPPVHKKLTVAQRLRIALRQCRRRFHRRHSRMVCERHARKRYKPHRHAG